MIVKYFAWIKDITNKNQEKISNSKIKDVKSLKKYLSIKYPKLKKHFSNKKIIQIAINTEYIQKNQSIKNEDEIAIFPPVSGG